MTFIKNKTITKEEIENLNLKYKKLSVQDRIKELQNDFKMEDVMLTSSFATTSAFLLHVFSQEYPNHLIYFIDTGYHFSETLDYKDQLEKLYKLNVESIEAEKWKHDFTTEEETWTKDPDFCCSINKVEPLEKVKGKHKVWVSGLMKWQSDHRSSLDIFELRGDILKFYPLLDITKEEREQYILEHKLPFHPLLAKGYFSIGCKHCTIPGKGRSGRWNNNPKTECGLHL